MSQKHNRKMQVDASRQEERNATVSQVEDKNMLNVAIIGIGNAGNQIAELARSVHMIPGVALNSSERDVSTITAIPSIVIGDEKGAGKDRSVAKNFIRAHARELLQEKQFTSVLNDAEVIFVISSTGGGTGSGMAPVLTDVLSQVHPNKKFILVGILPPLKESVAAQQNTIEYLKELRQQEPTYMLYDNNNYSDLPIKKMMQTVNEEIVADLLVIRGDYQHATPYNSIDEKDMMKIIETAGRLVIGQVHGVQEKDIDVRSVEDRLVDVFKSNAHVELDRDKIIKRRGLIVNLSEKVYESVDTNLPVVEKFIGEPIEGFEHIYVQESIENHVIAVLSGLSVPDDRVEKVMQRISEAFDALTKTKDSSILDSADVDVLSSLRGNTTKPETDASTVDIGDIFNKYN